MNTKALIDTARKMVADHKGLLAMDESIQPAINDLPSGGFHRTRRPGALIGT